MFLVDSVTRVNQETTNGKAIYDDTNLLHQMMAW